MINQIFRFGDGKRNISDYECVLYKWDDEKEQVYSDFLSIKSLNVELNPNTYYISINKHGHQYSYDIDYYSMNKLAVDRSNIIGKTFYKLIKDIQFYDVDLIDCQGYIEVVCPVLKEYIDNNSEDGIYEIKKVDSLDKLVFTLNFVEIDKAILELEAKSYSKYIESANKYFDRIVQEIYKYFKIYSREYSNTALMCPKCYKSHNKLSVRGPLFAGISVYEINGKHTCPYCEYEGTDDFPTIDSNMAKLVYYLNHHGIKTIACCSGHSWYDYDIYMMMDGSRFKNINKEFGRYYIDEDKIEDQFGDLVKFEYNVGPSGSDITCRVNQFSNICCDRNTYNFEAEFDNFDQFSSYICNMMLEIFKWVINDYKIKTASIT